MFRNLPPVCLRWVVKIPTENKQEVFLYVERRNEWILYGISGQCAGSIRRYGSVYHGIYDRFIGSIHDLAFGKMREKKSALIYLAKLGVGWIIGMAMAVVVLSTLFESHIYAVSSLFIGFIAGAIPLIIKEESPKGYLDAIRQGRGKNGFREIGKGILFCPIGIVLVAGITWANGRIGGASMDLGTFQILPCLIGVALVVGMQMIKERR